MERLKNIALVAHDNRKKDLVEWVEWNCRTLLHHHLIYTGTTGKLIEKTLTESAVMAVTDTKDRREILLSFMNILPSILTLPWFL